MKKNLIAVMVLFSGVLFAQVIEPKYEIIGKKVKATYYFDNGQVKQEGFYKDGKLTGQWVAFNEDGSKQSEGEYENGIKTGKWYFWTVSHVSEVTYSDNKIAKVTTSTKDAIVHRD